MRIQFVHLPKCGGRSVELLLKQRFGKRFLRVSGNHIAPLPGNNNNDRRVVQVAKAYVQGLHREFCVYGHIGPLPALGEKFVFVRHPVSRLVSEYFFFKSKNPEAMGSATIDDFAKAYPKDVYQRVFGSLRPSYIGVFEQFDRSCQRLADRLGIPFDVPHVNKTSYPKEAAEDFSRFVPMFARDIAVYDRLVDQAGYGSADVAFTPVAQQV